MDLFEQHPKRLIHFKSPSGLLRAYFQNSHKSSLNLNWLFWLQKNENILSPNVKFGGDRVEGGKQEITFVKNLSEYSPNTKTRVVFS